MHTCFINYRTGDGEHVATNVRRTLADRFGDDEVFLANRSIEAGEDFEQGLLRALARCEVLFAVIGNDWLDRPGPGGRALDDPSDWVRREIASVLKTGVVVPVLFDRAPRLKREQLPEDLQALAQCQYRRYDHRNSDADLEQIVEAALVAVPRLEGLLTEPDEGDTGAGVANSMHDVSGVGIQAGSYTNHGVSGVQSGGGAIITGTQGPVTTGTQYNNSQVHNGSGTQNNRITGRGGV
ncbi:toll/interleukin-1 receptor domain-containing protein [Nocardiopsis sp. HNM0947]|uniref:Toll/interleukin-1 receptor domain-containing protein n=1 Tax=Nocardiopsis coralli TaxID=2772213 RepID=A0ABR9PC02_9ACTN|nr:toll/interleukin-1 receptor domain-containing protein [Nocardiopsis coralli]MBE3001376.1 toll/interleukin-1 receptor domain-containing protein [Nocardiopsis coralli]